MDDLLSEKEQIDQIRSWWSEYGAYIIGGLVVGVGILVGMNYYSSKKLIAETEASNRFETLAEYVADTKLEEAEEVAAEIQAEYSDTVYAAQAGLALARLYMDRNRDQDAADALMGVVENASDAAMQNVARLRLARIYLYQDKPEDAVALLDGIGDEAFAAPFGEVLGDAYAMLGQVRKAEAAYQSVVSDPAAQSTVDLNLVQWKILDLPPVEAGSAEPTEVPVDDAEAADDAEPTGADSEASGADR